MTSKPGNEPASGITIRQEFVRSAMQGSMYQNQDVANIAKHAIATADACIKLEAETRAQPKMPKLIGLGVKACEKSMAKTAAETRDNG